MGGQTKRNANGSVNEMKANIRIDYMECEWKGRLMEG